MEKIIDIDGRGVKFKSTAATIRLYRQQTGKDLLVDIQKLQKAIDSDGNMSVEALAIFEDIAYVMAKQADPSIPDTADEWLDSFGLFSIYVILPQIVELWQLSSLVTADLKKKA